MLQEQTVSKPESAENSERVAGSSAPLCSALVMFSSGISSWAAAKRYAERNGTAGMVLLFADTLIEDEDNYRFLSEAAENIGAPLEIIRDGRTPWEVMEDVKLIGNSQKDPCSDKLKRKILRKWHEEHCDPETCEIIYGISWDEIHRYERVAERMKPWKAVAPLCERPLISKGDQLKWALAEGIKPPRMYRMGFPHANCGGFCIKAGQASFRLLLRHFPERYREHEEAEERLRGIVGDHSILNDRRGDGKKKVLTLRELRERIENEEPIEEFDFGGCACALPL